MKYTLIAASVAISFFAAPVYAGLYTVTDLGTLGGTTATVTDINNNRQIVGRAATTSDSATHAFIWQSGVMHDLGTFGGLSAAYAINSGGSVVGYSTLSSGSSHSFLYDATNGLQDLGAFGGDLSQAYGINDAGQIVGRVFDASGHHPFVYSAGVTTGVANPFGGNGTALAINNSGAIVGGFSNSTNTASFNFLNIGGTTFDLGSFGDPNGNQANAINLSGSVVGQAGGQSAGQFYSHAFLYDGLTKHDLGTLGGRQSSANDINNDGVIVGNSNLSGLGGVNHAWIYESGLMADLNALLDPSGAALVAGTGSYYLSSAVGINDDGWIVANSSNGRAYLLAPVPEPSTGIFGAFAIGVAICRRMRTRSNATNA